MIRPDAEQIQHAAKPQYNLSLDSLRSTAEKKVNEQYYYLPDDHIESSIFDQFADLYDETCADLESQSQETTPTRVRKNIRSKIAYLFGEGEKENFIPADEVKFRPKQSEFLDFFNSTAGNVLLGLRTGEGKTTTYMHLVLEQLKSEPDQYVVITTPKKYLRTQIIEGCIKKFGTLADLKDQVVPLKKNPNDLEQRLVIDTPQSILNMMQQGKLDPRKVSLLVMDEGAIGTKAKTGDFPTFKIAELISENKDCRLIVADGTPIETGYLEEKFEIKHYFYGEDPRFVSPTYIDLCEIESTEDHHRIMDYFNEKILLRSYDKLMSFIKNNSCLKDLRPMIEGFAINANKKAKAEQDDKKYIPFLRFNDYREVDKFIGQNIDRFPKVKYNAEKVAWMRVRSCLSAFKKLQDLSSMIDNESYRSAIDKIDFYIEDAKKTNSETTDNTLARTLLVGDKSSYRYSPLLRFRHTLSDHIDEGKLHPKEIVLQKFLDKIKAEGKKVLIISEYIPVINQLNYLLNERFNHNAFAVHGGSSKKNRMRQQYAIEMFKRGDVDVLIGTSVLERGLDLPELDYVIVMSPSRNAETELQVRGRLRKGGTMIVFANQNEKYKYFSNRNKSHKFFRERARSIAIHRRSDLEDEEKNTLKSKFHGKRKTENFVKDLAAISDSSINKTISERFLVLRSEFIDDKSRKNYSVKVVLSDKTGVVDYYYYFDNKDEAQRVQEQLSQGVHPVIVNGRIKISRNGMPYLIGHHTPGYFIEGIIECPKEDVPNEDLGMIEDFNENPIKLSEDAHQLTFTEHLSNNPMSERDQAVNNLSVQKVVKETRKVLVDEDGQRKLPF